MISFTLLTHFTTDNSCTGTPLLPSLPLFLPQGPDVLIGHTTYDYYIVAWPRIVKETVLPSG